MLQTQMIGDRIVRSGVQSRERQPPNFDCGRAIRRPSGLVRTGTLIPDTPDAAYWDDELSALRGGSTD